MEWLGGEVGFREDIEGVAALLGGGEDREMRASRSAKVSTPSSSLC
jgi:hypothetical protein